MMPSQQQKIVPHLWFDTQAKEAAEFYCSVFPDSRVTNFTTIHDTPSGDCDILSFTLMGCDFMSISAGPLFTFNPSVSFMVRFDPEQDENARIKIDDIWARLAEGGKVLMPLDEYPFSERYGWIQDQYGLSWQLILANPGDAARPAIVPSLLFVGEQCGKTEAASAFYINTFKGSKRGELAYYPAGMEPDKEGTVMYTDFALEGQWFAAMDSAREHGFGFNEAISFIVNCKDQQEIDHYWERLSAVPEAEQCGWLKDEYGLSWQIVPDDMNAMMADDDRQRLDRVTQALLPMKKLDLAALQRAFAGE